MYAQVDFGQKKLRTSNGKMRTVYFMAMLLCNSRHKFIYFQDKPFTSGSAVTAHEKSFEYFKGIPKNIIYDQDAVFPMGLWGIKGSSLPAIVILFVPESYSNLPV